MSAKMPIEYIRTCFICRRTSSYFSTFCRYEIPGMKCLSFVLVGLGWRACSWFFCFLYFDYKFITCRISSGGTPLVAYLLNLASWLGFFSSLLWSSFAIVLFLGGVVPYNTYILPGTYFLCFHSFFR